MKIPLLRTIVFLLLSQNLIAQNQDSKAHILKNTNVQALMELSSNFESRYLKDLKKAIEIGIDSSLVYGSEQIAYFSGFDKSGKPVYDVDDNLDAAISCRVDKIWNGGSSGLNLDGTDVLIGQWESRLAMTSHQEFNGRVTHGEFGSVSSHATRMACTMIGFGVNSSARGMASNARLVTRTSGNDESELAAFGASGGILSNHSYSPGNPNGNTPYYGYYANQSQEWDEILYNAPYLTTVKSAGNNRNDGVNTGDGGYDVIHTLAGCKNLITIGAVNDLFEYNGPQSVVQSSFSDWGPTDDWRIKPDLVTNGVGVFSGNDESDTSYSTGSGTSQACAAATGIIALLHQHYHNLFGEYMKAATVKALLLSTTDEAGQNDGPDFQNGWGLLNAERAADVITNNGLTTEISELTLANGESYTTTIETDGQSPLSVMIAWTDPPGVPLPVSTDNLSPMLINDLDMRLTNSSDTYEPWTMIPGLNNFGEAAAKGDNFRDNVERIDILDLDAGIYTVNVTHKGILSSGRQDFSLVINGLSENSTSLNPLNESDDNFIIFPNPSISGFFKISVPDPDKQKGFYVRVYNSLGDVLYIEYCDNDQGYVDLSNFSNGPYFMHLFSDSINHTQVIHIVK